MDDEMIQMAYVYANLCTQQEEKYGYRNGDHMGWGARSCYNLPWEWDDCEAAWELMKETTTGIERYELLRKGHNLLKQNYNVSR